MKMGVEIKATKTTNFKNNRHKYCMLNCIPTELITEIVARVAACSSDDLFKTTLSCKTLQKIADDKYIIRHVSLDKFSAIPWTSKEQAILDRCTSCENPEAMYRHGIIQYFGLKEDLKISGFEYFKRAANLQHLGAMYVIGIISLLNGGENKQTGMQIIGGDMMKKFKITRKEIKEIRDKFLSIVGRMWAKNTMRAEQTRPICCTRHELAKPTAWDLYEDEDVDLECEACFCDQEILHVWECIPYYM